MIWGTDVVVSHCKEKFRRFILKYEDRNVAEDEHFEGMDINQPYYLQRLEEVNNTHFNIGFPFRLPTCLADSENNMTVKKISDHG